MSIKTFTNENFFFSTESGRDNPFRPDGDISREADEIVQKIKAGQPLEASALNYDSQDGHRESSPLVPGTVDDESMQKISHNDESKLVSSVKSGAKNGSATGSNNNAPGPVEIKHATVVPNDPVQVEHVVLSKKKKACGCCVIQ